MVYEVYFYCLIPLFFKSKHCQPALFLVERPFVFKPKVFDLSSQWCGLGQAFGLGFGVFLFLYMQDFGF